MSMFVKQQSVLSRHQLERMNSSPEARPTILNETQREAAPMQSTPQRTLPATTTPEAAHENEAKRLIVGHEVKLRGAEILDCDTLIVEGTVEATMDSRVIRICKGGAFKGKVSIDIAEIHGEFEGDLTARQQLVIHASGRVRGNIRYGQLLVESGGSLAGDIQSLDEPQGKSTRTERTQFKPALASITADNGTHASPAHTPQLIQAG